MYKLKNGQYLTEIPLFKDGVNIEFDEFKEEISLKLINDDYKNVLDLVNELNQEKEVIIVTDPPFNRRYSYNKYSDNKPEREYFDELSSLFKLYPSVVIHYPEELHKLSQYMEETPLKVCSWVYNSNTYKQHRDIAFYNIKPDFDKVMQPYKDQNDKRNQKRMQRGRFGGRIYDWQYVNQVKNISSCKTDHPCQMPIEIMEYIVALLPEDIIVFDPFMGSGTTGVACKNLNKNFIGVEIDEVYFNISKRRINDG